MAIQDADDKELERFGDDLLQQVLTEAAIDQRESMLAEAFTDYVIELLTELGEWPEGYVCYHRQRGAEVSGWGWDIDTATLHLSVTAFEGAGGKPRLAKRDADAALKRAKHFFELSLSGLHEDLEEASPQFDLAYFIHQNRKQLSAVRLFLFTDSETTRSATDEPDVAGIQCRSQVWDLPRLHRVVTSGNERESIDIDLLQRYGRPLACLPAPTASEDFESYLLVIPGDILADLYNDLGPRLLELNVRSFLQARGKVNRGIRDTIEGEPDRFFAYNNGISATASAVDVEHDPDGTAEIRRIVDLQIVNGGQTTASIATAARRDEDLVKDVYVQAKLTVVPRERIEDIVPLISRYANSQNRVSEADLSANHRFHVGVEELSRTVWAPAPDGGQRETRWFYERARGQYQDALGRERTPARKKAFRQIHPTRQKFTKTDLAKFENAWAQKPHIVSRGAQKSFVEFMLQVESRPSFKPDQEYFERLCAKALMFRAAERIVSAQNFGGYRANIVAYTLAFISHDTAMRVDLERIWSAQSIGPGLEEAIEEVCKPVHDFIIDPPGGQNVTEWCKKEDCWKNLRDLDLSVPQALVDELIDAAAVSGQGPDSKTTVPMLDRPSEEEQEQITWVSTVPAETWFGIAKWAKTTSQLQPWQRGIAFSLGKLVNQGREPSRKQARQGRILHDEALELGYDSAADKS